MSYNGKEGSLYDGRPVTVYHFNYGGKDYWYTSADTAIKDPTGSFDIPPVHIKHGTIKETTEDKRASVKIELDAHTDLGKALRVNPVDSVCKVNILRTHRNDTAKQWVYYWRGNVSLVGREEAQVLALECSHMLTALATGGLRARYNYHCPHALYGPSCRAKVTPDKTKEFVVSAISGSHVSLTGWSATKWWDGGQLHFASESHRRYIMTSNTTGVTLDAVPRGLSVGDTVTLQAGCDRTKATCQTKFSNLPNYGGYLAVPVKNPFQDGIV
ncbi:tail assembly protein [Vibrio phage vB_VpaS_MAR10]|uniref:Bacteriophage phiJL001 Gp84 C-terminal domain-containing protein n=1 Tax=Vibrio phage vB_VpaS_MAR10 TaxID=1229755 RepID=K7R2G6_9CAUD|nr:tail assembly protein [Vibrio phage vB_VpaS_MAR10]AFV81279.1 hypothetical protein MAR10_046 [Vibrio phage vB_VpaS_MAR10]